MVGELMRHDPLYTRWTVTTGSEDDARRLRAAADGFTEETVIEQRARAFPGGFEAREFLPHRLGDYFAAIRTLPGEAPASFRILFHRRPEAGRYWKDLMMRVLQRVRDAAPNTSITLDYRGDTEVA
jgi:hypothetical protein